MIILAAALSRVGTIVPPCEAFQARLVPSNRSLSRGRKPDFHPSLRNTSTLEVKLVDTRDGRRPDLGDTYYQLVVLTAAGGEPDLPRDISDPGPLTEDDWFVL